jgi:hypothetical protein
LSAAEGIAALFIPFGGEVVEAGVLFNRMQELREAALDMEESSGLDWMLQDADAQLRVVEVEDMDEEGLAGIALGIHWLSGYIWRVGSGWTLLGANMNVCNFLRLCPPPCSIGRADKVVKRR